MFTLPPLPYAPDALEPIVTETTVKLHYDVLHRRYVATLNRLITEHYPSFQGKPLEEVMREAAHDEALEPLYRQAAQAWNHAFYWNSLSPYGGGLPSTSSALARALGAHGKRFRSDVLQMAASAFGSAWLWIVTDPRGNILLWVGEDADNPIIYGYRPLLVIDLWEHAYMLDYGGDRAKYVAEVFDNLLHWPFAESNYGRWFG